MVDRDSNGLANKNTNVLFETFGQKFIEGVLYAGYEVLRRSSEMKRCPMQVG